MAATSAKIKLSNTLMTEDRVLVSSVLSGDTQAFRLLIKQHERLVAHMVARLVKHQEEREELCQDVFLRVFDKLGEFTFQSKLSTWIATIAYRHGINHLRKKKLPIDEMLNDEHFTDRFVDHETPEETYAERDMNDKVLQLVDQLPPQYRTILTLYHVEGMNYPEIVAVTGMPEGTVKNYLFRARNLLKEKVKTYLGKEAML